VEVRGSLTEGILGKGMKPYLKDKLKRKINELA
jgi:hypothetical protein